MSGFSNPIVNAAGTLIKTLIKSANYVAGTLGWQISKDGNAEFNLGSFRGSVTVTAANGSKIVIDASQPYPTMFFYSKDGTNYSQLSLINAISATAADFWISSGQWAPAIDGIFRAIRLYMSGAQNDHARFSIDRVSDGSAMGGRVSVHVDKALLGYRNDSAVPAQVYDLVIDNTGKGVLTAPGGLFANGTQVLSNEAIYTNLGLTAPYAGNQQTAGPDIMPGNPGLTFTKKYNATRLSITIHGTFYTNGSAGALFGVNIAGSGNWWITGIAATNPGNFNHLAYSGVVLVSAPMNAGVYTITTIWGKSGGAGYLLVDSGDFLSMTVREIP